MIGKFVKIAHVVGVLITFSICIINTPLWKVVSAEELSGKGALTLVESSDTFDKSSQDSQDNDDGVIISEETDNEAKVEEETLELFEPTSEWQTVKDGQKIPEGLHVRLNLQTGKREAKLLDDPRKKKNINQWYAGEKMGVINTEKQRFSREELKKALKDFKLEDADASKSKQQSSKENKFRSYDELKDIMKDMKMSVKTEAEIVTELMNKLKGGNVGVEDMKTIFIDMEYYLHQFDNARLFCDLGGMQMILSLMNSTNEEIRSKAALALGSALQSNAQVQVNALESGVLQQLLRLISVDESAVVRKKALFALSTLLRQFPFAQKRFLELGGLSAVTQLFSKLGDEQLKIKIVTLLSDLVQENDDGSVGVDENGKAETEKSRQYSEVKMREALQRSGWCKHLASLLHQHSGHDNVEKVISAMTTLKETCKTQFSSLQSTLQLLSSQYSNLAKEDREQGETDSFFDNIHTSIEKLIQDIKFKREDL